MFGRYRLLGRIAAGGMAEVWAAQLLAPGGFCKAMVIKRVLPELASNPSFLRMLMNEARVAARLSHTNICSVFELGEVEGEYYIAMEYLRGVPLTQLLKAGGKLTPPAAVSIIAQICDGLHYAHEQKDASGNLLGLVHRDVSPHNLFITVDGIVKLLDFGIAKVDDGSSERTEAGKVKGKLAYMSPEQLAADPLDRRSDVWSLGVVLWELLTGKRLFSGGPAQTIDGIRNARVPSLTTAGIDLPDLDEVLVKAMARDPERRYPSAAELRRAMVSAIHPIAPAQNDSLSQILWARCGAEIRANDKKFATDGEGGDVVERLPLRAETTQLSQEIYVRDGVDASALSNVLAELEPRPAESVATALEPLRRALRNDTSPDLPSPALQTGSSPSAVVAARRGRGRVVAVMIAGAAILGMAVGVLVRRGGDDVPAPPPATGAVAGAVTDPSPQPPSVTPLAVDAGAVVAVAPPDAAPAAPVEEAKPEPPSTPVVTEKKRPREKERVKESPPSRPSPARPAPGKLYVNAVPWATIYVDGKKLGPTPIVGKSLPAGEHTLKAITEDGRVKTMRIKVEPGGEVRRKVTW